MGPWPGIYDTEAGVSASFSFSLLGSELTTSFAELIEFAGKHVQGGQTGAVVPASYFRTLRGRAVDLEGNPITDAIYILALDNFATVGTVDDEAYFEIDLLKTTFQEFRLIVDAGDEQFEYVWYEDENANIDPDPTDQDVTMQFKPAEAIGKTGLNLTGDLSFT